MAITTIDGVLAGCLPPLTFSKALTGTLVAGRPFSTFYLAGIPAAAAQPTPGIGGASLTSYGGQMPWTNPTIGLMSYLARFQGQSTVAGTLILCDRLRHNSGIDLTITTEQVFTGASQIPARDRNGSNLGDGVYAALEVSAVTGAGTPTITLKYTDQGGATGATATNIVATAASSGQGSFYPIGLASGDTGIQKAESLTLSATRTSGTAHVVLYREIARLELTGGNTPNALDALTGGLARMYDNSVPFFVFIPSATTTSNISGHMIVTQG